jgi:hypothetical protein
MTTIKIWHPELQAVGESADDVFDAPNHPLRMRGWQTYPATPLQATDVLGRHITDLGALSNEDLILVAQQTEKGKTLPAEATVEEVVAWIGDDAERALSVLKNESTRDKPRKTLVDDVAKVVGADVMAGLDDKLRKALSLS